MSKKFFIAVMFLVLLFIPASTVTAQITETFNGETVGAQTFSEGTASFNATGYFEVTNIADFGYNDNYFMENVDHPIPAGGLVGSFTNTANFYVNDLYIIPVQADNYTISINNNLVIRGKLGGTTQFTHTLYYYQINNSSANNYYTYLNLGSYSSIPINELEFEIEPYETNTTKYIMIDQFRFTMAPVATAPTVTTNASSGIGTAGATLNGTVNANLAITAVTFQYGLTTSYGSSVTADQSPVTGSTATAVSKAITSLSPNTLYHYRAVGVNSAGTTYGSDATFTTNALPPSVASESATNVTNEGATLNGTINANGVSTVVTFEYGLTTAYGSTVTANQSPVTGTADTPVSKTIVGLVNGTTYHYRVVGVSTGGTSYGFDKTFATRPEIPVNVVLLNNGLNVSISWNAVTGATSYKIYSSTDPYSGYVLNTSGTFNGTTWTAPSSGNKSFYFVVAVN